MQMSAMILALLLLPNTKPETPSLESIESGDPQYEALQAAGLRLRLAVTQRNSAEMARMVELDVTKRAFVESLSDPSDPAAGYFFGARHSMREFFRKNPKFDLKVFRQTGTSVAYVCFLDASQFRGEWSLPKVHEYMSEMKSVLCTSFYSAGSDWYLDLDIPPLAAD